MFDVKLTGQDNKIATARINYSIATMNNKVYIYGGINEKSEIINSMEIFDATTYKFSEVKYRGDHTIKGRQGHASIALDRFNMYVIGGTTETGLVDPEPIHPNECVWAFDLEASTWHPKS